MNDEFDIDSMPLPVLRREHREQPSRVEVKINANFFDYESLQQVVMEIDSENLNNISDSGVRSLFQYERRRNNLDDYKQKLRETRDNLLMNRQRLVCAFCNTNISLDSIRIRNENPVVYYHHNCLYQLPLDNYLDVPYWRAGQSTLGGRTDGRRCQCGARW
jgi:hypothetical protein